MLSKRQMQTFNKAVNDLLEQGMPSLVQGRCMYRGAGGKKCPIGHLIHDSAYSDDLEGENIHSDDVQQALFKSGVEITFEFLAVLSQLQDAHDSIPYDASSPDLWLKEFLVRVQQIRKNCEIPIDV